MVSMLVNVLATEVLRFTSGRGGSRPDSNRCALDEADMRVSMRSMTTYVAALPLEWCTWSALTWATCHLHHCMDYIKGARRSGTVA